MNTFLWTLQIVLGTFFTLHGAALAAWAPPLRNRLENTFSKGFLQFIGVCELLGGIGLILPWWLGIAPVLTPLAATGLTIIMIGAVVSHVRARETPQIVMNSTIALLLAVVASARWGGGLV